MLNKLELHDAPTAAENTKLTSTWQTLPQQLGPKNAYLTAMNGVLVGRTFKIGSGRLFIGRADDCDIVLDDDGVSRRHALIIGSARGTVIIEDLQSTNGLSINGKLSNVTELVNGDRIQFGSSTVFKFEERDAIEEGYAVHLYETTTKDQLTGVHNISYLREQLESEFTWHAANDFSMALIFLDIDRFKSVNDNYGHLTGDEVLRQVAIRCDEESRTEDIFARYGGEEFACLLRRTPIVQAARIAERMRLSVANAPMEVIIDGALTKIDVTLSAGVAGMDPNFASADDLIAAADRLLYQAKAGGRNKVMLPTPPTLASDNGF